MARSSKTGISRGEYLLRQLALRRLAPHCLSALDWMSKRALTRIRRSFAIQRHVRGEGLEVGAAVSPSVVPPGCSVRYLDKFDAATLRGDPELSPYDVLEPDILDDVQSLATVPDDSQDFVLAFSVFEHLEDPLHALDALQRVTRAGGSIVLSVPDKRFMEDRSRPLTSFEHLLRDYREGAQTSRAAHFREVGERVFELRGQELERYVADSVASATTHTHFHVWDAESFLVFLLRAKQELGLDFEIVEFATYGHEVLAVLKVQKTTTSPTARA